MSSIHQVNHPGKELKIFYRSRNRNDLNYYFLQDSSTKGIRLWNRCSINGKSNSHKRKFIEINGKFVYDLNNPIETSGLVRFWGEYEGYSGFELVNNKKTNQPYWDVPCAIHRPFFCDRNINDQNTDPFVFGKEFYYAICKKNDLKNLSVGDIILFGFEFGNKGNVQFYLDTLFIVKATLPSILNNTFDMIYQESTLKRIGILKYKNGTMPIHTGVKFTDNQKCFSFFPCKPVDKQNSTFGRPIINTEDLRLQKPGARTGSKSRALRPNESIQLIWSKIVNEVLSQGFCLGTHADNISIHNSLP